MTKTEAIKWLSNLKMDIGKTQYQELWHYEQALDEIIQALEQEPIIHCKDCKHFVRDDVEEHTPYGFYNTYFHAFCDKHYDKEQGEYIDVKLDDYCSFAERRAEE